MTTEVVREAKIVRMAHFKAIDVSDKSVVARSAVEVEAVTRARRKGYRVVDTNGATYEPFPETALRQRVPPWRHSAAAAWRLCAGLEKALARYGGRVRVADVLVQAEISRRTYYDLFSELGTQIIWAKEASRRVEHLGIPHPNVDFAVPCFFYIKELREAFADTAEHKFWEGLRLAEQRELPVPADNEFLKLWVGDE